MVLELEEALDRVPIAAQGRAECGRFDPVSDRLDIRPGALGGYGLVQGVAVAGRVCEQDPPRLRAVVHLTPGNASDVETVPEVLAAAPGRLKRPGADRGYGADRLRRDLGAGGTTPVIPGAAAKRCSRGRRNRKHPIRHDRRRHRDHWRVEATIGRLKDFRRVATCYDKLARNYAPAVDLAAIVAFWC